MSSLELGPLIEGDAELRMLDAADLRTTLAWRNDPRSRSWFHTQAVIDWDAHQRWFEQYRKRTDDHVFVLLVNGTPAAQVSLYGVAGGHAEFGRLLVDPDRRGEGLGSLASRLCLRVGDDLLGLDLIHLEVKDGNAAAIRIYASLGFEAAPSASAPPSSIYMVRRRPGSRPSEQSAKAIN